ncbi:hypothetical protein N7535_004761 [Penicillium sp. DV-2018c]|nr:hypothetical protein N7461_008344 [Penicillium sp. DV-2018c]KAJ5571101.1 hypothetical protein N7535_004761 [Penicillium sp. DV-2018c]
MSWKLTKKLKETHLSPLTSSFGRSSSTSTIRADSNGEEAPTPATTQPPSVASTTTAPSTNGIAASESLVSPPVAPVNPGILIVTLHEGRNFSLSPHFQQIFNSHFQNNSYAPSSLRPSTSSSSHSAQNQTDSYVHSGRPQSTNGGINAAPTNHGRYSTKYLPYALLDFEKNQVFVDAVSGTPECPLWAGDNTAFKFDVSRKTELNFAGWSYNRPVAGLGDAGGSVKDPSFGSIPEMTLETGLVFCVYDTSRLTNVSVSSTFMSWLSITL